MPDIAYQLYCSRNFPPLSDTCKMLGEAGYKNVEGFGGLFDDMDGLQHALELGGLSMTSSHMGLDLVIGDPQKALEIAKTFEMKKVYVPFIMPDDRPTDAAGWTAFGEKLAEAGKQFIDNGIDFGWHNHDFEFVATPEGALPIDLIVEAGVGLELDLGWVARAGHDPVAWIEKYAGKISGAHVKDIAAPGECADEDGWADVGHGVMDWTAITAALSAAGVDYYVVEHDNPNDAARFAQRSIQFIKNL